MKPKVKFSLGKKLTVLIILLSVTLSAVAIFVSYKIFSSTMTEYYVRLGTNLVRTLAEYGAPPKAVAQVNIAADEIFSNIARYSGAADAAVDCRVTENRAVIRFLDDGRPYDPTGRPEPDIRLSAEDREIGGLGIFMVRKTMDRVSYAYAGGQNILTIEKRWQE